MDNALSTAAVSGGFGLCCIVITKIFDSRQGRESESSKFRADLLVRIQQLETNEDRLRGQVSRHQEEITRNQEEILLLKSRVIDHDELKCENIRLENENKRLKETIEELRAFVTESALSAEERIDLRGGESE